MLRLPVESSDIVSIGYDEPNQILEIEFNGGRIYQYQKVHPETYAQFMRAESFGQYFNSFIQGHFRYQRIENIVPERPEALAFVSDDQRQFEKLQTASKAAGVRVERLTIAVDEIQSNDPEVVVQHKVKQAYKLVGRPVLVSVACWDILALRGFPGCFMDYVTQWLKPAELLRTMEDKNDRSVSCTYLLAYYDGRRTKVVSEELWGKLCEVPKGRGSTIDQLMIVNGQNQTLAERGVAAGDDLRVWDDFVKWFHVQRRLGKA